MKCGHGVESTVREMSCCLGYGPPGAAWRARGDRQHGLGGGTSRVASRCPALPPRDLQSRRLCTSAGRRWWKRLP